MPELPEVEALRRGLLKSVLNSTILKVEILNEKLISGKGTKRKADKNKTSEFINNLKNKKIISIERRAKNLIFKVLPPGLSRGIPEIILVHLKMTGQMVFVPGILNKENLKSESRALKPDREARRLARLEDYKFSEINDQNISNISGGHPIQDSENKLPHKHTYIIFHLDNGTLYYNDVRQFGYVLYYKSEQVLEQEKHFEKIGLEPFDKMFTLKYFEQEIKKYNSPIKKVLLEQKIVVGCGNIYCDEICFASSILPTRLCKNLKEHETEKIYENIKSILDKAINSGGSSIANYLLVDGTRGNYADYHKVYQKTGTKCTFISANNSKLKSRQCAGTIEKINLSGRGTHFCPVHQK